MTPFYTTHERYGPEVSIARALEEGRLTPDDLALIREYVEERQAAINISAVRANKLLFNLVGWRRFIPVPFREATMGDIYAGLAALKNGRTDKGRPFRQNTVRDYTLGLKTFLRWMIENGYSSLPEAKVKKIRPPPPDHHTTSPDGILSIDEVEAMLRACRTPRDRAFVSVLYESAGRVAEVCRLRWKDVAFDQYGTKLYLDDTKTGRYRFVRLTLSTMALTALQNSSRGEPEGYVFTMRGKHSREPMTYNAVASLLCRVSKEAGVEKRVHPHLFRKTRITHMISQGYNTSVVMKAAWGTTDSHMMRTYLQLAEQDIDGEFLRKAGVAVEDEGNARRLEVRCPRCHTVNPPDNDCCGKCGMPLTAEAEERIDLLWGDLWELVASNPEKAVEVARALSRRG